MGRLSGGVAVRWAGCQVGWLSGGVAVWRAGCQVGRLSGGLVVWWAGCQVGWLAGGLSAGGQTFGLLGARPLGDHTNKKYTCVFVTNSWNRRLWNSQNMELC